MAHLKTHGLILVLGAVLSTTACGGSSTDIDFTGGTAGSSGASGSAGSSGASGASGASGSGGGGAGVAGAAGVGGGSGAAGQGGSGGDGGISGSSGTGGVGGGPQACTPAGCPSRSLFGFTVPGCCGEGNVCGLDLSNIPQSPVQDCVVGDPGGRPDATCPPLSMAGFNLAGCCLSSGQCGYQENMGLGLGCVDPSSFGQPTGQSCGGGSGGSGGGGGTAGTGGTGGTGGGTGGTGGGTAGTGGMGGGPGGTGGGASSGPDAVSCGNATCSNGQACCLTSGGFGTPPSMSCGDTCSGTAATLRCDAAEDCGTGQVCCATFVQQGPMASYRGSECASSCTGTGKVTLCTPGSTNQCPRGQSCQRSQTLPAGFGVCR